MWLGEEAKMGLILSVYYIFLYFVVHLDGYVQRILKTLNIIDYLAKHKRLSTKLSTIWQIIDYLSKKIDYRLIVDIID